MCAVCIVITIQGNQIRWSVTLERSLMSDLHLALALCIQGGWCGWQHLTFMAETIRRLKLLTHKNHCWVQNGSKGSLNFGSNQVTTRVYQDQHVRKKTKFNTWSKIMFVIFNLKFFFLKFYFHFLVQIKTGFLIFLNFPKS